MKEKVKIKIEYEELTYRELKRRRLEMLTTLNNFARKGFRVVCPTKNGFLLERKKKVKIRPVQYEEEEE